MILGIDEKYSYKSADFKFPVHCFEKLIHAWIHHPLPASFTSFQFMFSVSADVIGVIESCRITLANGGGLGLKILDAIFS